ncbi:MAG: DUF6088 family protein [Akkermansia sp.]|nr:DUF6088 family protein [Akkermansia sp.]
MVQRLQRKPLATQLLEQYGPGAVFSSFDFRDSGYALSSVRSTFSRMSRSGALLRLSGGYYAVPRISRFSGRSMYPGPEALAAAVGRRYRSKVMPSGAILANKYQLSTQVPAKDEFLVAAPPRRIRLGKSQVVFLRASKAELRFAGTLRGELSAALQYMKSTGMDDDAVRSALARALTVKGRRELESWAPSAPAWMRPLIMNLPV